MADVTVEILAVRVPINFGNLRFVIKTWWAHVEVDPGHKIVKLPSLPLIEKFYHGPPKEAIIFIEVWYKNDKIFPSGAMRFLGIAQVSVDELIRNPARNPLVEWLSIHDLIENIKRGNLLMKIDVNFPGGGVHSPEGQSYSSCDNTPLYGSSVKTTPSKCSPRSCISSSRMKSISIQTDEDVKIREGNPTAKSFLEIVKSGHERITESQGCNNTNTPLFTPSGATVQKFLDKYAEKLYNTKSATSSLDEIIKLLNDNLNRNTDSTSCASVSSCGTLNTQPSAKVKYPSSENFSTDNNSGKKTDISRTGPLGHKFVSDGHRDLNSPSLEDILIVRKVPSVIEGNNDDPPACNKDSALTLHKQKFLSDLENGNSTSPKHEHNQSSDKGKTTVPPKCPPRSRRIAAAIYNDYEEN